VVQVLENGGSSMAYRLTAVIEKDSDGYYAYCPELEGCQSQGETLEEAQANIQQAIELYLETLSEVEREGLLQREVTTMTLEVQVA
jgi:predicted RNase H-like HicB family nuclease